MTDVRDRIADRIASDPGVHFNELVRTLDLAPGQVQYHLRRLTGDDRVIDESLYGRTHYFPPEYDDWERGTLALARRETARDVLLYLLAEGPVGPKTTAADLGIARSTLEWHLDRLVEQALVEKRRDSGNRVTLAATRPEATTRLLREVEPSLTERMADRFERLVDNLLAG